MALRLQARIAGALWLISIIAGMYAELFVRARLFVHGDAAATATSIMAEEPLFRTGFAIDLVADMAYLGMTLLLYRLLRPASRTIVLVMLGFGLVGAAVMAANLINLFAPVILLDSATLSSASASELTPLVLVYLRLHSFGYSISIALFSIQVAAMGLLILRSTFFPRIFGVLFVVEAVCDTISSFGRFLDLGWVERLGGYILVPGLPAEGGFALWLLVVGIVQDDELRRCQYAK